jgi:Tfp pilus assembly protein PilX
MRRLNKKGSALVGAVLALSMLSLMGMSMVQISVEDQLLRMDQYNYDRAFNIAQAAIEYGLKKTYDGNDPVVVEPGINFGNGSFIISANAGTMTVTGRVGGSIAEHSVSLPGQGECVLVSMGGATLAAGNTRVASVQISKECLGSLTITQMRFTWVGAGVTQPSNITQVTLQGNDLYIDALGTSSGTIIDIPDYSIADNGVHVMTDLVFNGAIDTQIDLTIEFTMVDTTLGTEQGIIS